MNIQEFREKAKSSAVVTIEGVDYTIDQVVKFRLSEGEYYVKLFLDGGHAFADDEESGEFIFVSHVDTDFTEPFAKTLNFQDKDFTFAYDAEAEAQEVWGEGPFAVGDREKFWDFEASDRSYLSLGVDLKTGRRMDLVGKIIAPENVLLK